VGSGSFSYLDGCLYVNTFSLSEYDRLVNSGRMAVVRKREFGKLDQMQYRFMMELFDLKLNRERHEQERSNPPVGKKRAAPVADGEFTLTSPGATSRTKAAAPAKKATKRSGR